MSYLSCKSIMPKFLWKHIIEYLSYDNIININTIDSSFFALVDENDWRSNFLEHRTDAIVVVKCDTRQMDYFWKYASQNYISCGNINELFRYLKGDIKHNTTMVHYKVFIQTGEYPYNNYYNGNDYQDYNFSNKPCSIEINGSKSKSTSIRYTNKKITNYFALHVVIPKYFSIKHIIFHNVSCSFLKHKFDTYKCLTDDKFINIYSDTELYINNCIFEGSHTILAISSINKSIIVNCTFNAKLNISNGISCNQITESRMYKLGLANNIECSISHSTFLIESPIDSCININSDLFHKINFTNNTVLKAATLFYDWLNKNTIIQISNMDMCVQCCCNVRFANNHFDNVIALYDDKSSNITVDDTNTFINCSEQLMNQYRDYDN